MKVKIIPNSNFVGIIDVLSFTKPTVTHIPFPGLNITVATRVRLSRATQDRLEKPVRKINVYCFVVLLCTADAIKMKINIFTIVLPLFIFTDRVNSANLQNIIGQSRGSCPTGSVGEFATFGFLTFMITLLNTILNLG